MNASQESSDFVEPAPRPLRPDQPVQASTSRVTLDPVANSQVELLSDESNDHDAAALAATAEANGHHLQANETTQTGSTSAKQMSPPAASPSKVKVFLKSTSPDVPLHFHLPRELSHTLTKKLQVTIKAHGGVMESRFGKADLIVVDPQLKGVSKRLLRDANQMGQPIPVIVPDYIYDCAAQGEQLDFQDTKYKYHPALALADPEPAIQADPAPRTLNGRNPFTESDRQAIVSYFVDKQESSWSLNAAARELAVRVPTHTYTSFQSYLQANFDKGWNLKQKILAARRDIIQGEPSELQARIFRSQYTASPGLQEQSEQCAPSDGGPRASPQPQAEPAAEAQPSTTSQNGREPPLEQATLSQSDDNDQDLLVRRPNPGTAIDNVEKSPTKTIQPVQHAASEESDPGTSPPPSFPLSQRPPGSRFSQRSPSADEESDPEHYSPRIMSQIQQAESSRHKPSQKPKQPKRRPSRDSQSSSDFDSELDQTDQGSDQDLLTTGPPATQTTLRHRTRAQESEDSEWHGSRRLDSKMRLAHSQATTDKRVKFLQKEKDDLFKKLVEHVMSRGSDIPPSTQDAMLDKPTDAFWNQFAALHPRHSAASWRSHYLKNRLIYKQIVELKIQDRREEEGSADEEDTSHAESQDELASQSQQSQQQGVAAQADLPQTDVVARQHVSKELESDSDPSVNSEDVSMPADGIVIMLPRQPTQGPPAKHVSPEHEWPEAPPPPPIEDEDEDQDMMQVESQVNTLAEATPLIEEEEEEEEEDEDEDEEEEEEEDEDEEEEEDEDEEDEEEEEMPLPPPSPEHSEFEAELESVEDISDNEINDDVGRSPTKSPAPSPSRTTHFVEPPSTSAVEAGTPVLVQHRDAPFYDFTMDSDEEQRIRQARSRPSLPNMQLRQGVVSSGPPHRPPITTDRVLGHFATPSRSQKTAATRHISLTAPRAKDDRIERTREWTRSVSAASSSASPELVAQVEPVAITESSRSRASRIDQRPLLGTVSAADVTPSRLQARSQLARRPLSGGYVPGGGAPRPTSSTSTRSRAQPVVADFEAARLEYRAEAERFRRDFGLDREQRNTLLKQFNGNIKDARKYIASWLQDMQDAYAVEAAVAFEYVKASQGDFEQAEAFLRLAAMTRSSSTPSRSTSALSRSFSGSVSPAKRSGRIEDNSLSRLIRKIDHNQPSSKRVRR